MKKYRAILFDLDETLLDFTTTENMALDQIYNLFFHAHVQREEVKTFYNKINRQLWHEVSLGIKTPAQVKYERFSLLLAELKLAFDPKTIATHFEKYLGEQVLWFPGVEEAIAKLYPTHTMGIVTNGITTVQENRYIRGAMSNWCRCCVISESVGFAKPDPRIFSLALQQIGTAPEQTLMVGDSLESDFLGALNSHIDFCWINPKKLPLPAHLPKPALVLSSVAELPNHV
jgi:YjjG family noncanonical pyrimidine nucleotidase